jgi:hypothetical protein
MRRKAFALTAALLAGLLMPKAATAKDFPESVLAVDPLAAASNRGIPAGLGGAFEYGNYLLAHDDVDSFYLRTSLTPVIFTVGDDFALGNSSTASSRRPGCRAGQACMSSRSTRGRASIPCTRAIHIPIRRCRRTSSCAG